MFKEKIYSLLPAIIIPFILLISIRVTNVKNGDIGTDCYYHVRMATMPVKNIAGKVFPSMTLSLWSENFSNKELLFHLILKVITNFSFDKDPQPPFHIYSIFLLLLFTVSFAIAAHSFKTKHIWFYSTALFLLFPLITMRIMFVRPHVLAMSFMCLSLAFFKKVTQKKHLWIPFILGFIFVWAYSSPHFIMVTAILFGGIYIVKKDYIFGLLIISVTFCGLLAGMTLHPQFPNTFYIWYVQSVQIVREMVADVQGIYIGWEMSPPDVGDIVANSGQYILLLFNFVFLYKLYSQKKLKAETAGIFIFALFWGILFFLAKRSIEYGIYSTVLATGVIITDCINAGFFDTLQKYKWHVRSIAVSILIILIPITFKVQKKQLASLIRMPYKQFSEWVKKSEIPDGSRIANLYWSDFPFLFYGASQYRYLFGIDPMFAYYVAPEKIRIIQAFSADRIMLSSLQCRELTGSDFLFIGIEYNRMNKKLYQNGYRLIYQGRDGCLFQLAE